MSEIAEHAASHNWTVGRKYRHRETRPTEIVFWMCLVAFVMLAIYVKVTHALELHWLFVIYSVAVASLVVGRYVFFKLYRPALLPLGAWTPELHVVMACRNESRQVCATAHALRENGYPDDKLKITIVDDGSTDDTAVWLAQLQETYGWEVITLPESRGKRRAIAVALAGSDSEITVLMDSDVQLAPDALEEIVRGFADERIAAVSGHTGVANAGRNLLTRMQEQYYYLSYRLFRSAEAHFRTVNCCTGAFSAYRTARLREVADEWSGQTFLGRPRNFGDDRSLTHLLLRDGWDTVYQPYARSETMVPEGLSQFLRQQGRWRRGFFIEAFKGLRYMWRRPRGAAFLFYLSLLLALLGPVVVFYYLVFNPLWYGGEPMGYLTAIFIITVLHQLFLALFKEADALKVGYLYLMPAVPFWVFTVLLLIPLALLTLGDGRWRTRGQEG